MTLNRILCIAAPLPLIVLTAAHGLAQVRSSEAVATLVEAPVSHIAGRVLTSEGQPAQRAIVYLMRQTGMPGERIALPVDAGGRFARKLNSPVQPGEALVAAVAKGSPGVAYQSVTAADAAHITLRLQSQGTLVGRLVRPDGAPIPSAAITVTSIRPGPESAADSRAGRTILGLFSVLPRSVLSLQFTASTDSSGSFRFSGLPARGTVALAAPGLTLAPGSRQGITLLGNGETGAGILVAARRGTISIHVSDRDTGKPAGGLGLMVLPASANAFSFAMASVGDEDPSSLRSGQLSTDPSGNVIVKDLSPGDYKVWCQGAVRRVTVDESAASVKLSVRRGALRVRILNAAGRPAAGVPVTVEDVSNPFSQLTGGFPTGPQASGAQNTDANGRFEIPSFPFDAEHVTIRAARGNDEASWTGAATDLGHALVLRMKHGALVSVTGRLVDPAHKAVSAKNASLIRWQEAPRIAWTLNATPTEVKPDGRFRADGLMRGEAFSLLSGSPFRGSSTEGANFESPRFTTVDALDVQDLGEVVVHPLDDAQQVLQVYGIQSREQLAQLARLTGPPANAATEAQATVARYNEALQKADLNTIYELTSPASAGWRENRKAFLLNSSLRPITAGSGEMRPFRFIPAISVAYLLALSGMKDGVNLLNFDLGKAANAIAAEPDWLFLGSGGAAGLHVGGVLHREKGEWKIVNAPNIFGASIESLIALTSGNARGPDPLAFDTPGVLPDLAQLDAARERGEAYLAAWAKGDTATMLRLTSPLSTFTAGNASALRKAAAQRPDEGVCAIQAGQAADLEPVKDLTRWEQELLATYARSVSEITGGGRTARSTADPDFPSKYVSRGDLAPFRYHAEGREYLLLMLRQAGKWQVLEPALAR